MKAVKDILWKKGITLTEFMRSLASVGFQSVELARAAEVIMKMKKSSAKIYLTFTSNMVTSGLRGFFAQLIQLGMADVIVTTAGAIEEDIMKAYGESFPIGSFSADDTALHEKGENRVGNLIIRNESYVKFESLLKPMIQKAYEKNPRITVSEMLHEFGMTLKDEHSFLYQAAKRNVPVFCPGITDGALGFHLFLFQQKHPDFMLDVVKDFSHILFASSHDDVKGIIALGGSISKHYAILSGLLNGGFEYAVYMTTAHASSGSMSGATTQEAKSWGKLKDDSDAATVIGDVSITFPLAMMYALEMLAEQNLLKGTH